MTEHDDIDGLAAEYALGTLTADEKNAADQGRVHDIALDEAIMAWEQRLAPLLEGISEAQPSANLFAKIEKRLAMKNQSRVTNGWRTLAVAASLAFVLATGGFVYEWSVVQTMPQSYAVLQKDGAASTFLLAFNDKTRTLTVQVMGASPPSNKSYELWLIADGAAPRSMGIVLPNNPHPVALNAADAAAVRRATFAISLEPAGGSPTGAPTGPVISAGKFTAG